MNTPRRVGCSRPPSLLGAGLGISATPALDSLTQSFILTSWFSKPAPQVVAGPVPSVQG